MNSPSSGRTLSLIISAAAAALFTYLFDPDRGRRRRALLRDRTYSKLNQARDLTERVAEDLYNRTSGVVADVRSRVTHHNVPDDVLVERVRARLGRIVSHPSAIEVAADEGVIAIRGPILRRELGRLLIALYAIPGVKNVVNLLEVHEYPGSIPSLQGTARRYRENYAAHSWSPATRLAVGLGGGLLTYYSLRRRPVGSTALASIGLALIVRAFSDVGARRRPPGEEELPVMRSPVEPETLPRLKRIDTPPSPVKH